MKIPEFKASKRFLDEYAVSCRVAKIKNSDVPGLATQHIAHFKEKPKLEIHLREKSPGKSSKWMQAQLEQLFAKDGLAAAVAAGIKELGEDAYNYLDGKEGRFIKQHGFAPYVYVKQLVIDEVKQKVLMIIDDGFDVFTEHGGVIYQKGSRWRIGDFDDFYDYTGALDKYKIDPHASTKAQQKKKLDELFPPSAAKTPVIKDGSPIYGRWEVDVQETNKLLKKIGQEPYPAEILSGGFYVLHETYIESKSSNRRVEGWECRGNWFTANGGYLEVWFDGQRLVTTTLLEDSYTCRVYRKAADRKFDAFALDEEIPLAGAESASCIVSDSNQLFMARESTVDGLAASKGMRPSLIAAPNISAFAAICFNRICGLSITEEKASLMGHSSGWGVFSTTKTGKKPVALLYRPEATELYIFNAGDSSAAVYEVVQGFKNGRPADDLKLKQTIRLPAKPRTAVCDDALGLVYCSLEGRDEIAVIDAKKQSVIAVWPVPTKAAGAFSFAVDPQSRRLFVHCANKQLLMLDGEKGNLVASIPIGAGAGTCMFDDRQRLLFSVGGDGLLTIARLETAEKLVVVQTLQTEAASHSIAMEPLGKRIMLFKKGLKSGAALLAYTDKKTSKSSGKGSDIADMLALMDSILKK